MHEGAPEFNLVFGQDSQWGRKAQVTLWVGPFKWVQCTVFVAFTAEYVSVADMLHDFTVNASKVHRGFP